MGYDADSNEDDYLDYLAEHRSGFLCDDPPPITDMDGACARLVYGDDIGSALRPTIQIPRGRLAHAARRKTTR